MHYFNVQDLLGHGPSKALFYVYSIYYIVILRFHCISIDIKPITVYFKLGHDCAIVCKQSWPQNSGLRTVASENGLRKCHKLLSRLVSYQM